MATLRCTRLAPPREPHRAGVKASGGGVPGDFPAKRGAGVAEPLLAIAGARAAGSGRPVIVKACKSVRARAATNAQAAPRDPGALVRKSAG